jgi:hypothetical protein
MKRAAFTALLFLSACGGTDTDAPKVSRAGDYVLQGMSYTEFRSRYSGDDMKSVQKRFIMLDRDNNGVLTAHEYSGY